MVKAVALLIGLSIFLFACTGGEKLPSLKEYFKSDSQNMLNIVML
ncbi:hypothetical protein JGI17_11422 [Candidatus Kryptonium thompsonii]|nr:hypothetical protein JGI17_11422 [Candidatus Kryptonium thompsoni]